VRAFPFHSANCAHVLFHFWNYENCEKCASAEREQIHSSAHRGQFSRPASRRQMKEIKTAAGCALLRRGKVNWLVAFSCVAKVSCEKLALFFTPLTRQRYKLGEAVAARTCHLYPQQHPLPKKITRKPKRHESEQKVNADVWTTPSRVRKSVDGSASGAGWMHHFQLLESARGRLPVNFALAAQARFLCAARSIFMLALYSVSALPSQIDSCKVLLCRTFYLRRSASAPTR
jgi:hypothetical protein